MVVRPRLVHWFDCFDNRIESPTQKCHHRRCCLPSFPQGPHKRPSFLAKCLHQPESYDLCPKGWWGEHERNLLSVKMPLYSCFCCYPFWLLSYASYCLEKMDVTLLRHVHP